MIKMIAACTTNGVIGVDGKIPFDYPADMKHFRKLTLNSTVIMGRKTFEGIGKALPKRRNIVISSSSHTLNNVEIFPSIISALEEVNPPIPAVGLFDDNGNIIAYPTPEIWFIGGASIYQEGMKYAEEIHLTITPDEITNSHSVKFPWIDPTVFTLDSWKYFEEDSRLKYCIYKRI